jgi:hypothetical protein
MFKVQWLSHSLTWHTDHACNNERSAIAAALRLSSSGRYVGVRVVTRDGAVVFSA